MIEEYFGCSDTDTEKWKRKMRLGVEMPNYFPLDYRWALECTSCSTQMLTCCPEFVFDLCHRCWEKTLDNIQKANHLITNPALQHCAYCEDRELKEACAFDYRLQTSARTRKRPRLSQVIQQ